MTDEQLQELEALEQAATPGPWDLSMVSVEAFSNNGVYMAWHPAADDEAFVVKFRNALPALLAEVKRLRARVAVLESVCRQSYEFVAYVVENNATILPGEGEALRRLSVAVDSINVDA